MASAGHFKGLCQPAGIKKATCTWHFRVDKTFPGSVMSYAGLKDVRSQFFYEVDDDLESHEEHLRLAYDLGRTFLAPEPA
jgi:hypothetical protein